MPKTVMDDCSASISVKKSRFIAQLAHIESKDEAIAFLEGVRKSHPQARHNVYAFILASGEEQASDDGEPAQTGGKPTLDAMKYSDLCDAICVTTRYFGGVLLGTGGLVRAYSQAARDAISNARLADVETLCELSVKVGYPLFSGLKKICSDSHTVILNPEFSDAIELSIRVRQRDLERFLASVRSLGLEPGRARTYRGMVVDGRPV